MRNIIKEVREQTAHMDKEQKWEHIFTYYWYHMLTAAIAAGLLVLFVRHIFFRAPDKEFICVLINQAVDYDRDKSLAEDFAGASGIGKSLIYFDSDYQFSYEGRKLEGVNESSYEKFFFRWSTGELDAVIMPESFYKHCIKIGNQFADLRPMLADGQEASYETQVYTADGRCDALYVKGSRLEHYIEDSKDDPMLVVFIEEGTHQQADQQFLDFIISEGDIS